MTSILQAGCVGREKTRLVIKIVIKEWRELFTLNLRVAFFCFGTTPSLERGVTLLGPTESRSFTKTEQNATLQSPPPPANIMQRDHTRRHHTYRQNSQWPI